MSEAAIRRFRVAQAKEKRDAAEKAAGSVVKKGKQRAHASSDQCESEDSAPVPSPLEGLASLGKLVLDSGDSTGNTPADSHANLPVPTSLEGCVEETKTAGPSGLSTGMQASEPVRHLLLTIR